MNTWTEGEPVIPAAVAERIHEWLARQVAESAPVVLERAVLAVATLHDVDDRGRCRVCAECRPRRWPWWRRVGGYPCPTRRVMSAELLADTGRAGA